MDQKYYIRIGEIPNNEISGIYNDGEITGFENGVSVYNAINVNGNWYPIMPLPIKFGQGKTYECLISELTKHKNPRKVYLVTGNEVGIGTDNEPILKNINVIDDITNKFLK